MNKLETSAWVRPTTEELAVIIANARRERNAALTLAVQNGLASLRAAIAKLLERSGSEPALR